MKDKKVLKEKILQDEDFIYCPRLGNSVEQLLKKNPDGIDEERMSKVLLLTEDEISDIYNKALKKIKDSSCQTINLN